MKTIDMSLNTLIEDYERRLKTLNEMVDDNLKRFGNKGRDNELLRLKIKRGMVRSFLHELKQLNKD